MEEQKEALTPDEERGVEAIVFLQKLGGIAEPRERALRNWRAFSMEEARTTMTLYEHMRAMMPQ